MRQTSGCCQAQQPPWRQRRPVPAASVSEELGRDFAGGNEAVSESRRAESDCLIGGSRAGSGPSEPNPVWPRVRVLAHQLSPKHTVLRHPPEQLRSRFRLASALLPITSATLPGPHVLVHEARKGHSPARCPQDPRRTSAGPSCRSSLLPRPSPGPRPPYQFPDFSRRRAPVRLVSSLAVLPVHPVPGPGQWVPTGLDLRPSRDTAPAVLRQLSRPLAPRLRLGHLAPSRYLCPRDSSAWHLASTPPSRAPHRQQKHRSGQQTRLSKLAFLSPQTVQGCWRAPNWSTPCRISRTRLFSSSACLALDSFDRRRLRGWAAESRLVTGKPDECMCKAA